MNTILVTVELTYDNTTVLEDAGANMLVQVYLDEVWEEIKNHKRMYLQTYLRIPVIHLGREFYVEMTLRNHYEIATISGTSPITVVQDGYLEYEPNRQEITEVNSKIWFYDTL